MKVLITGGTGFVGKHLVSRLASRGDEVTVLSRNPDRASRVVSATRLLAWNPSEGPPPVEAVATMEAVVNLLGESIAKGRWSRAKKRRIHESRVIGTRNLVAAISAVSARPKVLVSSSAIGFYGPMGEEAVDEGSPAGDGFLARVSREWESEARAAEAGNVRVVLLRTGIVLGRGGGALQAMLLPFRLGLGGPVGSGRQWMSWIHIDDLCQLILHAIDQPALRGAVNATAPNPVQNREFARTLGSILRRPALLPAPAFALRVLLGEMAGPLLITGQRVLPRRAMESGFRFAHPHLEGALRSLLGD